MALEPVPDHSTDPTVDRYAGLPAAWSDSAKETFAAIEEANPSLTAAQLASLYEAASLLATADAMQLVVDVDGLTTTGSQGQMTAHPLLSEIRLHRVQALAALKAIGLATSTSAASAAGTALVNKRWTQRNTPGRRSS